MYQKLRREVSQITRKYLLTKHSTGDLNTVLYVRFYVVMPHIYVSRLTIVSPEAKAVRDEWVSYLHVALLWNLKCSKYAAIKAIT